MNLLMDKRMRPLFIIVGLFLVLLVGAWLFSNIGSFSTSKLSYSGVEDKIAAASEDYFNDNKEMLPKSLEEEVEIDVNTLVNEKYMKNIDKYVKGATCSGKAIVKYTNVGYVYKGLLDCGSEYTTPLFKDILVKDVVSSGNGIYKINQYNGDGKKDTYVFRGEIVNNYVKIGEGDIWNVVKVDNSGDIMIISNGIKESYVWDDRYNIATDDNRGINDFEVSRIKDNLLRYTTSVDQYVELKKMITSKTVCVGKRGEMTIGDSGAKECSETLDNQYFSLLPVYDFMTASLDNNCRKTTDISCSNYNYLSGYSNSWWSLTGSSDAANKVYHFNPSYAQASYADGKRKLRIVAYLDSNTVYVSGTGTEVDPYIIK